MFMNFVEITSLFFASPWLKCEHLADWIITPTLSLKFNLARKGERLENRFEVFQPNGFLTRVIKRRAWWHNFKSWGWGRGRGWRWARGSGYGGDHRRKRRRSRLRARRWRRPFLSHIHISFYIRCHCLLVLDNPQGLDFQCCSHFPPLYDTSCRLRKRASNTATEEKCSSPLSPIPRFPRRYQWKRKPK